MARSEKKIIDEAIGPMYMKDQLSAGSAGEPKMSKMDKLTSESEQEYDPETGGMKFTGRATPEAMARYDREDKPEVSTSSSQKNHPIDHFFNKVRKKFGY